MKQVISLLFSIMGLSPLFAGLAFVGRVCWEYTVDSGVATIVDTATLVEGEVIIPAQLGGYPVKSIGGGAFKNCKLMTSVVIPEGVTSIGGSAFSGCWSLTTIVIPEGVTTIEAYTFNGCESLSSILLPKSITSVDATAFMGSAMAVGDRFYIATPAKVSIKSQAETLTPKTIKVTYTVKSELPSVKVRAVAWKDGKRSFANIVPVRTGAGVPHGESVSTNEEHTFVWDVPSDWDADLDGVAIEILVQEGTLLPQDIVTIPTTQTHKTITITQNALEEPGIFDALVWCFAEGDQRLSVNDGVVTVDGTEIARGNNLPATSGWLTGVSGDDRYWYVKATALLNYLYGKMGYKVLTGEDLEYAESATRLDFADSGLRQVSVKIEEGE